MPIDPFAFDRNRTRQQTSSEYGFGRGMFPDPVVNMQPDDLPYAPPMQEDQLRVMAEAKRMNVAGGDGLETATRMDEPSDLTYVEGNPDRFGAQPPLVRERGAPCHKSPEPQRISRFKRKW